MVPRDEQRVHTNRSLFEENSFVSHLYEVKRSTLDSARYLLFNVSFSFLRFVLTPVRKVDFECLATTRRRYDICGSFRSIFAARLYENFWLIKKKNLTFRIILKGEITVILKVGYCEIMNSGNNTRILLLKYFSPQLNSLNCLCL